MDRLNEIIIKHKKIVILLFLLITFGFGLCIPSVNVNYNLSKYLPKESHTTRAIDIMEKEFGNIGTAEAMAKVSDYEEAIHYRDEISKIDGIAKVAFADDFQMLVDMGALSKESVENSFLKDGYARFIIAFTENDYSFKTSDAIKEIREKFPEIALKGSAVSVGFTRQGSFDDVIKIAYVAVPLFIIILILMLDSYMEAFLLLFTMGCALVINMGSNIMFDSISFYSLVCMLILQFAISMDYSIFLLHKFNDEKNEGHDNVLAMKNALKFSLPTLLSSCLTTVSGMLALVAMRYSIGFDLGIVLAKGIVISLISCLVALPALVLTFHKLVEKTMHKRFTLKSESFNKLILKSKYFIIPIFLVIMVVGFVFQSKNQFLYGSSAMAASKGTKLYEDSKKIEGVFGINEPMAILFRNGEPAKEAELAKQLRAIKGVKSVESLYAYINPNLPNLLLPQQYLKYFVGKEYSRMIVYIDQSGESPEAFALVDEINNKVSEYYDEHYILGDVNASIDIKNTVKSDYIYVNLLSIAAVFIIIAVTFKKLSIPALLILVIEGAIWINMSIPYFKGTSTIFLGYIIVSSLQLGATIDYAILFSKHYESYRKYMNKNDALIATMNSISQSIIASGGILACCGIAAGLISRISAISELAMLVGRGAIFSVIAVLIVLPCAIYFVDKKN